MTDLKMTGDFYEDVGKVNEAIGYLKGMIDFLEKECMERDKGKTATELFIHINLNVINLQQLGSVAQKIWRKQFFF